MGRIWRGGRRRGSHHRDDNGSGGYLQYSSYDAAEVARVFEMLSDDDHCYRAFGDDDGPEPSATSATPSPAQLLYWAVARSPAVAAAAKGRRAPRATDSPADGAAGVDRQADEFIRRFYEQLRAQRSAASTPDYYGHAAGASPYTTPRARRPVAAGIV